MLSTRKPTAKARKSIEMDMLSDFDNLDVMLGNENMNPIERELGNTIGDSTVQYDTEVNQHLMKNFSHENEIENTDYGNKVPRPDGVFESIENFTNDFNPRLSEEMDSMMSMMHSQINSARSDAISDRINPELRNMVNSNANS